MATSRRELSDAYEAQDLIIQAAQDAKRLATQDYRAHLDKFGMDKDGIKAEVEGFKKAYRRKMDGKKKGTEAVEHVDAIADEIYLEITSPAPRATRVASHVPDGFDPETGEEITEPQVAPQPAQGSDEAAEPIASRSNSTAARMDVQNPDGRDARPEEVGAIQQEQREPAGTQAPPVEPISFADRIKKLRPLCQQPNSCRSSGGKAHCYTCMKASNEAGSAA